MTNKGVSLFRLLKKATSVSIDGNPVDLTESFIGYEWIPDGDDLSWSLEEQIVTRESDGTYWATAYVGGSDRTIDVQIRINSPKNDREKPVINKE